MRSVLSCCCFFVASLIGIALAGANDYAGYYAAADAQASPSDQAGALASAGSATLCDPACAPSFADCCDCECYDYCDCCNDRRRIGLLPSDHCFDSFISPLSNPFYFEDPRSLTEVRGIFIENALPSLVDGGDAQVFAGQIRGRVTDRTSIIAQRLGHLQVNESGGGAPHGFMSAPVGFKYNLVRDVENQFLLSGGITYFIKGSSFANFGDGDFHFFLTGGKQIFGRGHWLSASGFRIPLDINWGTQMWYWSNQWDYEVVDHIYGLVGINWFHFMRSANLDLGAPLTGLDLLNIPITGVAGRNVVSGVAGVKWKPSPHCEVGTGFEFPLTNNTDLLKNRFYADLIFRY